MPLTEKQYAMQRLILSLCDGLEFARGSEIMKVVVHCCAAYERGIKIKKSDLKNFLLADVTSEELASLHLSADILHVVQDLL